MRLLVNRPSVTIQLQHWCARWTCVNFLPDYLDDLLNGTWAPAVDGLSPFSQPRRRPPPAANFGAFPCRAITRLAGRALLFVFVGWTQHPGSTVQVRLYGLVFRLERSSVPDTPASRLPADMMARLNRSTPTSPSWMTFSNRKTTCSSLPCSTLATSSLAPHLHGMGRRPLRGHLCFPCLASIFRLPMMLA